MLVDLPVDFVSFLPVEFVGDFLGDFDARQLLEDGASDYLSRVCTKLLHTLSFQKVTHFEFSEILKIASLLGKSLFGTTVYIE